MHITQLNLSINRDVSKPTKPVQKILDKMPIEPDTILTQTWGEDIFVGFFLCSI